MHTTENELRFSKTGNPWLYQLGHSGLKQVVPGFRFHKALSVSWPLAAPGGPWWPHDSFMTALGNSSSPTLSSAVLVGQ